MTRAGFQHQPRGGALPPTLAEAVRGKQDEAGQNNEHGTAKTWCSTHQRTSHQWLPEKLLHPTQVAPTRQEFDSTAAQQSTQTIQSLLTDRRVTTGQKATREIA